ncbi:MAG: bifunctional GTP diphosphokinase/guanosine-3',5'-bis pyrophosphate 3'-pyrophosphohydrolase [Gammaproteobacteria bacterium]
MLGTYLEHDQIAQIRRAYQFGEAAHEGQQRLSGEPYISHPLAVARILAEMRLDHQSIMAAILHDVIEDTGTAKEYLTNQFGEEVADLVDGVSKLTQIKFRSKAEAQAENFRKMVLAMVRDIRVILVKLADRLHNMRTLGAMAPDKRRRIANETLEIYVPIANRLGLNTMRQELEELGFASLYPLRYRILAEAVRKARGNRKEILQKIATAIEERLNQEGLAGRVQGREKHLYSIYQKMRNKHLSFSEVFDVYAFRIIVDRVDACYRALGIAHNLYKPVPGKFKDYIAIPKSNGYQGVHTVLFGPYGVPIEIQIRTEDMDKVAESGIAAHWSYKVGDKAGGAQARAREWLRELLEIQKSAGNSLEFIENVKIDLFPDQVYVFTPKGRIMRLMRGATAVDFAYAVHTDVGNSCVAAKIDRHLAPLSTPLNNGQTVEIVAAPGAQPNPAWLNFVVTGKARANIRNYLKNLKSEEAISLGRRLLDKSLAEFNTALAKLPRERFNLVLEEFKLKSIESLYEDIGLGNRMAALVARRLAPLEKEASERSRGIKDVLTRYVPGWLKGGERATHRPLVIKGTEGMVVTFAKCCHPLPGDQILGFVTAGRGIVIHTESCKNVAEFRNRPEKWIDVQWATGITSEFPVEIRVDALNQRGALATVAAAIAEMGANIDNVSIEERDGKYSTLTLIIEVRDRIHLAKIMRRVRSIEMVARILRTKG